MKLKEFGPVGAGRSRPTRSFSKDPAMYWMNEIIVAQQEYNLYQEDAVQSSAWIVRNIFIKNYVDGEGYSPNAQTFC